MEHDERETVRHLLEAALERLNEQARDGEAHETMQAAEAKPALANKCESQGLHPGLERFTFAQAEMPPGAPKACFMEPGRACVNSGACEMRGY